MKRLVEVVLAIILVLVMVLVFILVIVFLPGKGQKQGLETYLESDFEKEASGFCTILRVAEWDHLTDLANKKKNKIYIDSVIKFKRFMRETWEKHFKDLNPSDYKNENVKRQIQILKVLGDAALDEDKLANLSAVKVEMINVYATARICPYSSQNCILDKDGLTREKTEEVFATSNDYDELLYTWKSWRDATGHKMKKLFQIYVELSNEAAKLNGFKDKGDQWRQMYDSPSFSEKLDEIWEEIKPFYDDLHKYVSRKLVDHYKEKFDISNGLIPAHVFRTMWTPSWQNLITIVRPFPAASKLQLNLKSQNFTILNMFEIANEFHKSMGWYAIDKSYDVSRGAILEKLGRDMDCTPTAVDFCSGKSYLIRMCAKVGFIHFLDIFHELGHIQYFMMYAKQPYALRTGANPAFHEAIGDTLAMALQNPKYLSRIKVLKNYTFNYESSINHLMGHAMKMVTFLPFSLILDKWRWDVFGGHIKPSEWNSRWWEYRKKYQKVEPPTPRSEEDFDPAAIFHFATDISHVSYFVAQILQLQFYKSLCITSGEYDPKNKNTFLHECDFFGSVKAGEKFGDGLRLGASKHWRDVLHVMTDDDDLSAGPLLEYFKPLQDYLQKENNK